MSWEFSASMDQSQMIHFSLLTLDVWGREKRCDRFISLENANILVFHDLSSAQIQAKIVQTLWNCWDAPCVLCYLHCMCLACISRIKSWGMSLSQSKENEYDNRDQEVCNQTTIYQCFLKDFRCISEPVLFFFSENRFIIHNILIPLQYEAHCCKSAITSLSNLLVIDRW